MPALRAVAIILVLAAGPATSHAVARVPAVQAPKVTLTLQMSPEATFRRRPLMLTCALETAQTLAGARLTLTVPPGLRVEAVGGDSTQPGSPAGGGRDSGRIETVIPSFSGHYTVSYLLTGAADDVARGQYPLNVRLTHDSAGVTTVLASGATIITMSPEQRLRCYLFFGALGIAVGYVLRLLIRVLSTTPAPSPAPPQAPATALGPITTYVNAHYYQVDFIVTLVLGLAAMLFLIKDGHLPADGVSWYGAGLLGLALGLLTNSELVTKLR